MNGGDAVTLLRAYLDGDGYPVPGVPDTPQARKLWDEIARDVAVMRAEGVIPEIPFDAAELPG